MIRVTFVLGLLLAAGAAVVWLLTYDPTGCVAAGFGTVFRCYGGFW